LDSLGFATYSGYNLPSYLDRCLAVFACFGVYSYNHVMDADEGAILADYLDGGGQIYLEGGDTWFYDTPTEVHPYFEIDGVTDGPATGDCGPVIGVDGTFTEGMSFSYSGDNSYMDRISPAGDGFTIFGNTDPVYDNVVAHNGPDYRTIGCAFDFGGLDDGVSPSTREDLMQAFLDFFLYGFEPAATIQPDLSCIPPAGTLPFDTVMTATLDNLYSGWTRRIAGRIDVTLAGGVSVSNWRSGYTNVGAGSSYTTAWTQNIPALGTLVGDNTFNLVIGDVTPAPYNQPPYPPAGDTATSVCVVTGNAP